MTPWAKTGGLADVAGALPAALDELGITVTSFVPRYGGVAVDAARRLTRPITRGALGFDVTYHVVERSPRRREVLVDIPPLFERSGIYGEGGHDYGDNAERFAMLALAALEFAVDDTSAPSVDVIHAHDWEAGLVPLLARFDDRYGERFADAGFVFTIHNLAYQGVFDRDVVPRLGLPWSTFRIDTAEFWGRFSFMKAGIVASDMVTTVSPTYARETLGPEAGCGLDGVLAALGDRYLGILNGIDTEVWNPATDPFLPARFHAADRAGKAVCKRALLERFGLPVGDDAMGRPLVAMMARLVSQKGFDLIAEAADELVELDAMWVFAGEGEPRYEEMLRNLSARYPSRVGGFVGFDEQLAHLVQAGADLFLMPSQYEPCGLNQLYSLRYGTIPVVTAVGGLDDTVRPYTPRARHANGFKFRDQSAATLLRTLRQAVRVYRDRPVWADLVARAMARDSSWRTPAREYVKVYRRARQLARGRRDT